MGVIYFLGVTSLISDPYHTTLYASCTDNRLVTLVVVVICYEYCYRIYAYDSVRLKPSPSKRFLLWNFLLKIQKLVFMCLLWYAIKWNNCALLILALKFEILFTLSLFLF